MSGDWVHVGRVWSNGEPLLVADGLAAADWRGQDEGEFARVVVHPEGLGDFRLAAGAGLLLNDAVVRDDSWIEVFQRVDGAFALVQAAGEDYAAMVRAALAVEEDDETGGLLEAPSGSVTVMSSACDGGGHDAQRLVPAQPGPDPQEHSWPDEHSEAGLSLPVRSGRFEVSGTWFTELGEGCYARWCFVPSGEEATPQ